MTDLPPASYQRPPQTAGKAIAALVFAILAWVACPVVFAVVALVLASQAADDIRASAGGLTGESLVTATRIIAWVQFALVGFALVSILAITFLGASTSLKLSGTGSSLERVVVVAPDVAPGR